jgi:cytochrome c553
MQIFVKPGRETVMNKHWIKRVTAGIAIGLAMSPALVAASSVSGSGAALAANCANCHGTSGRAIGSMPALAGQPKSYLVEQMKAFKEGRRTGTIMHQLAKGYTDEQIEAMSAYLSEQKR